MKGASVLMLTPHDSKVFDDRRSWLAAQDAVSVEVNSVLLSLFEASLVTSCPDEESALELGFLPA
jgi:hypothetical protein